MTELTESGVGRLRAMTEILPPFPAVLAKDRGMSEHAVATGTSLSWELFSADEVQCKRWFSSKGTHVLLHKHTHSLWLVIYKGCMRLTVEGQESVDLKSEGYMYMKPETNHEAEFLEDTWHLAISIPACKDA